MCSFFTLVSEQRIEMCTKQAIFPLQESVTHYFLRQILALEERKERKT